MRSFKHSAPVVNTSIVLLAALLLTLSACAEVRRVTYPDDFIYLEKSEVSQLMFSLLDIMITLDELEETAHPEKQKKRAILAELEKIEALTIRFNTAVSREGNNALGNLRTNHLLLSEHIAEFNADVSAAKLQLAATPPNYYVVGRLTGGCNSCHRNR